MKWLLTKTLGGDWGRRYIEWIRQIGVTGQLVGPDDEVPADPGAYQALLLTGGVDVNPVLYREPKAPETVEINDARDALELKMIRMFLDAGRPIFGVCRGIQILNVAFGGKLIQHIPAHLSQMESNREEHRYLNKKDSFHSLKVTGSGKLADALRDIKEVNSAHHQAIHPDAIGDRFRVVAVSEAGIIEAAEGVDMPSTVYAVQWHPERLPADHPASANLLKLMLSIAG